MQKKLCLGLVVTLLGVAVLLFVARSTSESDLRPVGETEAVMILGGGETGYDFQTLNCVTGSPGITGCSAQKNAFFKSADNTGGSYVGSGEKNCGGNCSGAKSRDPAKE